MSVRDEVVEMVREMGSATYEDLMPLLPHYTRDQIRKALYGGVRRGDLDCLHGRSAAGLLEPGVYRPRVKWALPKRVTQYTPLPPTSVWDLARA